MLTNIPAIRLKGDYGTVAAVRGPNPRAGFAWVVVPAPKFTAAHDAAAPGITVRTDLTEAVAG